MLENAPALSRSTTAPPKSPRQPSSLSNSLRRCNGSTLTISTAAYSPPPPPPPPSQPLSGGEEEGVVYRYGVPADTDTMSTGSIVQRLKRASRVDLDVLSPPPSSGSLSPFPSLPQPTSPVMTSATTRSTPSTLVIPRSPSSRSTSSTASQSVDETNSPSVGKCKVRGCWLGSELDGLCIQHFYAAEVMEKGRADEKVKTPRSSLFGGSTNSFTFTPPPATIQSLPPIPPPPPASPSKSHADLLLTELLSTEWSYLTSLTTCINAFLLRLRASASLGHPLLTEDEVATVFTNVETVHATNLSLYTELCALAQDNRLVTVECAQSLTRHAERFRCYVQYVCGYDDAGKLLVERRKAGKELEWFLRVAELCERCRMEDLLIQPVQRIPRYLLLLRSLLSHVSAGSVVHAAFSAALVVLSSLTSAINSSLHLKLSYRRVSVIAARVVDPPFPVCSPHRHHLLDAVLMKKYAHASVLKLTQWKRYWFILFNDLLMYTTVGGGAGGSGEVKVKHVLWLDMMRVKKGVGVAGGEGEGKEGRWAFEVQSAVKTVVVACESEEEREKWVTTLKDAIDVAVREKRERRRELEGQGGAALGEVKRWSTGGTGTLGSGGLCVVDDEEDEDDEYEALTPSPITPQRDGGRRFTAPAAAFTPPAPPKQSHTIPALARWGS